ncbi:hypothetical protein E5350_06770, partial [Lactobacillus johnsonii]|uniref:hypothetical protein n=1 Tax=Lactobacillus johnsonii TaxID=33959 RepID=UPI0011347BBA
PDGLFYFSKVFNLILQSAWEKVVKIVNDYYDSECQKLLLDIITKYLYKVIAINICYLLLLYEDCLHL